VDEKRASDSFKWPGKQASSFDPPGIPIGPCLRIAPKEMAQLMDELTHAQRSEQDGIEAVHR
jgi:hypothetical protein